MICGVVCVVGCDKGWGVVFYGLMLWCCVVWFHVVCRSE